MSVAIDIRTTGDGRVELRLRCEHAEIGMILSVEEARNISSRINVEAAAAAVEKMFAEAYRE